MKTNVACISVTVTYKIIVLYQNSLHTHKDFESK